MTEEVKFGTDGWRAVIGEEYTFANLERVALATANWLTKTYGDQPSAVVGYDTRFQGKAFATRAAEILASNGVRVHLSDAVATTPAVSWATAAFGAQAGVVITASHNPPEYSGYKLKADFGGPATPDQVAAVEAELKEGRPEAPRSIEALLAEELVELVDLNSQYLDHVREIVDVESIKTSGLKIGYDAMYGAGQGLVTRLLSPKQVEALHDDFNPGFHGQAPEPIERNLEEFAAFVPAKGCDLGLATDGDADRIGLVDASGNFVDAHRILGLLVMYLYRKGERGDIVKSFAATDLLDKMGEAYGLNVETTKIGFKYIASRMVEGNVLVGGEESGGIAVRGIPERDGILAGMMIAGMMVEYGKSLSELVDLMMSEFGPHVAFRRDLHIDPDVKTSFMLRLENEGLGEVAGREIVEVETIDGFKFRTGTGAWVMVRPSGTEPVLRVYSEAETREAAVELVNDVASMVGQPSEA